MVGVLDRFEIWSPARWETFVADAERLLEGAGLDVRWPLPPAVSEITRGPRPQEKPRR